ncbi:DUF4114 domain-containing protein [Methanocella sp. MCL-LM]|uniref:DUF4114 domain-containing protein n=1 Tax=Methanocella sp. MCL-LM TaxID=3412035 RepID=UPI003C707DA8
MQVEVRSIPGSYLTAWIEDESPDVVITSPWDDTVSEGSITLAGYVADRNITSVLTIANGVTNQITVAGGNFTTGITISGPTKITVSAQDSTGTIRTALLCLDGDMLPESIEKQYGFDPLNPDSDSALTAENEAGNGIPDGYEVLGGQNPENTRLPAFVKAKVGGDLFKDDTDDDGLSDYFEVMLLGPFGDVRYADYNGDGIPDAGDDLDQDGLTNADEQLYGTDPLVADTDKDGLQDDHEVEVTGTVPTKADSDDDGLSDDSEIRLGTLPLNFDTDGDGVRDGDETYTSGSGNSTLGTTVSVTGKGDLGKQLRFHSVATTGGLNTSVLISPVVDISLNGSFDSARITMQYAPAPGLNPANLSLCYYDRAQGRYVPVASQVDAANHTVSADVTHFSSWGIFEVKNLLALYKMVSDYNNEAYNGLQPGIPQPGDTLLVPYDSTLTMTYLGGTAGYNNVFGLWSPFRKQYGTGHGTTPGTSFNLGTFKQGTELIFYDDNGAGNTWLSGPYSRNPDRVAHAYIRPIACDTWLLGWEDMYGGGDKDYDDVVLNLTFTRTARVDSDGDGLYDDVEIHGFKD